MKDVANPFHFELNWYPEYSYCTIPDNIPEEEIKDRWRVLSQRVEPEEKGIPEFRNITLSDIKVENAERAFYANAYPEKPIHDIHWKDVFVEAEESGKLTYASNWTMENVLLKSETGKPIELKDCENIEQPEILKTITEQPEEIQELTLDEQISSINKNADAVIIPVNPTVNQALVEGDTTAFSENIKMYILKAEDAVLSYYEPLGDGFYYTPVEVALTNSGGTIEIKGQKEHLYTFTVNCDKKPEKIEGADSWNYDDERNQITIEKKGKSFKLQLN